MSNLEKELRKWREQRARKQGGRQTPADRRTLRGNGQEGVVITKPKSALALSAPLPPHSAANFRARFCEVSECGGTLSSADAGVCTRPQLSPLHPPARTVRRRHHSCGYG